MGVCDTMKSQIQDPTEVYETRQILKTWRRKGLICNKKNVNQNT